MRNVLFNRSGPELNATFLEWKRMVRWFAVLASISTMILATIELSIKFDMSYTSVWMLPYYLLMLFGLILPFLAPKEVRLLGSDTALFFATAKESRKTFKMLSGLYLYDSEANATLDERERNQRLKALAFSHKVTLAFFAFIIGHGLGTTTYNGDLSVSFFAVILMLIFHVLMPAAYLVWNYKPLETEFET